MFMQTFEFILLLPSFTSPLKISEPTWEAAMQAQAMKLSPPCFIDGLICFGSHFSTLWPFLYVILVSSVHKTLFQNFCGSSHLLILTTEEWLASCGTASTWFLSESSSNGWLRYLHPCPVELVFDVTEWCFGVSQCFCHQLLLFSSVDLSDVSCSVCPQFLSFSVHSKFLYKLSAMLVQSISPLF